MKSHTPHWAFAILLLAGVTLAHAGGSHPAPMQQNLGKRAYTAGVESKDTDQAWQGATLQTDVNPELQQQKQLRKQQLRQQLNLQFMSKRPYNNPDAE